MEPADEVVTSRSNPLVARLRALKARADADLTLIEGPKLLAEAVSAGVAIVAVAATPDATVPAVGVPVRRVDADVLASLSEMETSQGVLAIARRPGFDEAALYRGVPLVLVAAGVQNPGNLGGLLRTAEAAGASGAYLTDGCADPFSWKALRGSMGSAFRLPQVRRLPLAEVLARLSARGVAVAAAAASGTPCHAADLRGPLAIVVGPEGSGLPPDVVAGADLRLAVPMQPPVESLNVGVAAGVLLFEAARQRRA